MKYIFIFIFCGLISRLFKPDVNNSSESNLIPSREHNCEAVQHLHHQQLQQQNWRCCTSSAHVLTALFTSLTLLPHISNFLPSRLLPPYLQLHRSSPPFLPHISHFLLLHTHTHTPPPFTRTGGVEAVWAHHSPAGGATGGGDGAVRAAAQQRQRRRGVSSSSSSSLHWFDAVRGGAAGGSAQWGERGV